MNENELTGSLPAARLPETPKRCTAILRGSSVKRGRPKKERPKLSDPIVPGMSIRDIAAATGFTPKQVLRCLDLGSIPEDEFEAVLESDHPEDVYKLGRARNGKEVWYERRCPHCGGLLGIEGQS